MKWFFQNSKSFASAIAIALAFVFLVPFGALCQTTWVDPKADRYLRAMCNYMAGLAQFSVQTENSLEVVLRSGQKIQFDNPAKLSVKRPNKFHAERSGDIVNQSLYYNGKTIVLFMKEKNVYAEVEAPQAIEEAIDFAREYLDIYAPGGDLIYGNAYDILMEDVVSGFYVGLSVLDGVKCHHLAYRGNETDWQIWIEDGDKPLPKKFIITSKWMTGGPQFAMQVGTWNLDPKFDDDMFQFKPRKDAQKIDFIPIAQLGGYGDLPKKGEQP